MRRVKMFNGNLLEVGQEICFADLWQTDDGDLDELLQSGSVWVANDEYDSPITAYFEITDYNEENLVNTTVRITEIF